MSELIILWVNEENKKDPQLEYDNVIGLPSVYEHSLFNNSPIQILRGSRFSAKSWFKAYEFLMRPDTGEYFRGIFVRKTQIMSRDSQFQLFIDILDRHPLLKEKWELTPSKLLLTHIETGYYIKGGSFEKSDKIMGTPGVTDLWIDEPIGWDGSIQQKDFESLQGSLRNAHGIAPRIHLTFNPIGKINFIYRQFYDPKKKVYKSTDFHDLVANYDDNPFCPESAKAFLDKMSVTNPARHLVDGKGKWGEPNNDAPYLINYDDEVHYSDINFEYGDYETWITFDFNHTPCTSSAYQLIPGVGVVGIKSYEQNGGTRKLCQLMKSDKGLMGVSKLNWTITGDSNGKNFTATGGDVTDYMIIEEELGIHSGQIVGVHSRNKALVYSRRLNDEFLLKVPFVMSNRMENLRRDLKIAKEDKHGNLYKSRADGYGMDFFDHHRYFVHALCPNGMEDINYLVNRFR